MIIPYLYNHKNNKNFQDDKYSNIKNQNYLKINYLLIRKILNNF